MDGDGGGGEQEGKEVKGPRREEMGGWVELVPEGRSKTG